VGGKGFKKEKIRGGGSGSSSSSSSSAGVVVFGENRKEDLAQRPRCNTLFFFTNYQFHFVEIRQSLKKGLQAPVHFQKKDGP
jgi:hypothetical protein